MNAQPSVLSRAAISIRTDRVIPRGLFQSLLDWRSAAPWWYDLVCGLLLGACSIFSRMELIGATHGYAYTMSWPFIALAALIGRPAIGAIVIALTAAYAHFRLEPLVAGEEYVDLAIYLASSGMVVLITDALVRTRATASDERRKAEAVRNFHASLVESSNDATITKSLDGIVTSWNPAATRLFGYEPEEIIGQPATKLFPGELVDEEAKILKNIRRGEALEHYQTIRVAKDGRALHVSITISPIYDEDGAIVGASKILKDVTNQKQITDALRASEQLLRCALDGARAGAWSWDCVKMQSDWSPRFFELHGLSAANQKSSFHDWLNAILEEDRPRAETHLTGILQSATSDYHDEYRVIAPGGERRWVEIFGRIDRDQSGAPLRIAGITIDATARHRAVEDLERSNQDLARANESLKKFSYVAAHDLQEPMRKIEQFGDLFAKEFDDALSADGVFYLGIMRDSARRMRALINDLLAFARAGNRPLAATTLDMNGLAQSALAACSAVIEETHAQIDIAALPTLVGDKSLVESLFRNLVSNAIKYAKPNLAPRLRVSARNESGDIILDFADEGVGIAEEHQQIIFEPFTRLNSREPAKGSGIGLAFCRTVCERHGWRLTVTSDPNLGSTFSVFIPHGK